MARTLMVICALACAACGGSAEEAGEAGVSVTTGGEVEGPPPAPVALVPTDAFSVLRLDLAQLRLSPYWPVVSGWLDEAQHAAVQAGQPLDGMQRIREVLDHTDELVVATVPPDAPGTDPEPVFIARGSFAGLDLQSFVAGPGVAPSSVSARQTEGATLYVGPELCGAAISDHTWLVTTPVASGAAPEARLESVLGRYRSGGGAIASDALRAAAEEIGLAQASAAFAAEILPDMRGNIASNLRIPGTRGIEQASTVGARLELGSGLSLVALAHMQSDAAAEQLASQVQGVLAQYGDNVMVRMMGVGPVFDGTTVTADGPVARLSTELDDPSTRQILDRLGSFISLALQSVVLNMTSQRDAPGAAL